MSMPIDNPNLTEGMRRLQTGDAPGAILLLEEAVAREPTNGSAFQYLGIARTQVGDVAGGVAALQQASELMPTDAGVWFNLGIALSRAERTSDAQVALQRAVTLDPTHTKARLALDALPPIHIPGHIPPPPYSPAPAPILGQQSGYVPYAPSQPGGVAVRALVEPPLGTRIARGLGWGLVYGQWWTLLNTFWFLIEGGFHNPAAIFYILLTTIVFTLVGALTGFVAAVTNARGNLGNIIGVVAGMLLFAAESFFFPSGPLSLINVFFWFVTGKFVGDGIARQIQKPVAER